MQGQNQHVLTYPVRKQYRHIGRRAVRTEEQILADKDMATQSTIAIYNTFFFRFRKIQEDDCIVSSFNTPST